MNDVDPAADPEPDLVSLGGADRPPREPVVGPALARLGADRRVLLAIVCAVVAVLLTSIVGWVVREAGAEPSLTGNESHGLTPDAAACFAFGRVENRAAVTLDNGFTPSKRAVVDALAVEVEALGALGATYPEADDRLIAAFDAVAAVSSAHLAADGPRLDALVERNSALDRAALACTTMGGFDITDQQPVAAR